jgi:hypothetical protein
LGGLFAIEILLFIKPNQHIAFATVGKGPGRQHNPNTGGEKRRFPHTLDVERLQGNSSEFLAQLPYLYRLHHDETRQSHRRNINQNPVYLSADEALF